MRSILIFSLLLPALSVRADTVLTEKVEGQSRSMTMTLKIKGHKVRMDATPQMSTITDLTTGDVTTIMHAGKTYMTVSRATMEQLRNLGSQSTPANSPAAKPKLVDTGKSEKVGAYNGEIYTMETSNAHFTFWETKDIPNYATLEEQLRKFRALKNAGGAAIPAPDTSAMQGVPIKTQIVSKGQTLSIIIVSAEEKPIADSDMAPPPGYSQVSIP